MRWHLSLLVQRRGRGNDRYEKEPLTSQPRKLNRPASRHRRASGRSAIGLFGLCENVRADEKLIAFLELGKDGPQTVLNDQL